MSGNIKTTATLESRNDIFWVFASSFVGLFHGKMSISINQDLDVLLKDIQRAADDRR